ncbi:methionyl-tRNA formyltransferase, partial [Capnocytophaga granulosa]
TLALIASDKAVPQSQPKQVVEKPAPKIHKETSHISWEQSLAQIDRFVRGMSPYPTAWAQLHHEGETYAVKIYEATPQEATHNLPIGRVLLEDKQIKVAVQGGFLKIESLQFPSKKRMSAREFLNGFHFAEGDFFA